MQIAYLYHFTFPELIGTIEEIINIEGFLYTGKNRKDVKPRDLWVAWQRDVARAARERHDLPQHVMDYFQETKHLARPPQEGNMNILENRTLTPVKVKQQENFSWSWTALSSFESCSYAYAEQRVYKTVPYVQTVEAAWGDRVHITADTYFKKGVADPETLPIVKPYCDALISAGGELLSEQELAIDRSLIPCGYKEWSKAWGRGIIDAVVIKDGTAYIYDFKTGKIKDDMTQLLLFCAFLALHRKDIQRFLARYIWLKDKKITGMDTPLERREIVRVWQDLLPRVRRMEEAWHSEAFSMRKNGLCGKWCPVVHCPHNGKYKGR